MQSTRYFIRLMIKFSSSMKLGHYYLCRRFFFTFMNVYRHSPSIIGHSNCSIIIDSVNFGADAICLASLLHYNLMTKFYNVENNYMGSASRWWLYCSLKVLSKSLNKKLSVYHGDPQTILNNILKRFDIAFGPASTVARRLVA